MTENGDTSIVIYCANISPQELGRTFEALLDFLAERGLAAESEDADVRTIVGIRPVPFPDPTEEEGFKTFMDEHSQLAIPMTEDRILAPPGMGIPGYDGGGE